MPKGLEGDSALLQKSASKLPFARHSPHPTPPRLCNLPPQVNVRDYRLGLLYRLFQVSEGAAVCVQLPPTKTILESPRCPSTSPLTPSPKIPSPARQVAIFIYIVVYSIVIQKGYLAKEQVQGQAPGIL